MRTVCAVHDLVWAFWLRAKRPVRPPGRLSEQYGPDEPDDEECDGGDRPDSP